MNESFSRFLQAGLLNSVTGFSAIAFARRILDFNDIPANMLGYTVGLFTAFVINRAWVFRHTGRQATEFLRFLVVFAFAYSANILTILATALQWPERKYLPHAAGMIAYTMISYAGSRYFVFRPSGQ